MIEYRKELFEMELLNIQQIEKYYGNKSSLTKAIDDISFSVAQGEFLAIMGASGSGKTTLLRCLNFLETPDAGSIAVKGETLFDAADPSTQKESEIRRKRLHFNKRAVDELFAQASSIQKEAKECHDALEQYYIDAVDFTFLEKAYQGHYPVERRQRR